MTSEKFKYDPDESKEVEPPLDASFYLLVFVKKKAEKDEPEVFHQFLFSDYRLFRKLALGFCLCFGKWLSYEGYTFEEIEKLKKKTTVEERKKINDEYGFLLHVSSQYKIHNRNYIDISTSDSIPNEAKHETLLAISKKKATELTPLDKLYLKLLLK